MIYLIYCLSFVHNDTEHTYTFLREDFSNGILSTDTFNSICQYLTELTTLQAPTLEQDLELNHIMVALNKYGIPISYGFATDFTSTVNGWSNKPYTEPKEESEINKEN